MKVEKLAMSTVNLLAEKVTICNTQVCRQEDKEAEPSRKGRGALNPSFSGRGRTLLPWRERESGNCC